MTRLAAIATTGLLAAAVVASANPAATAADGSTHYREHDYAGGQARYVLPPGENGLVNAADAARFKADGTRPANSADQRPQYADLLYGYHDLTDGGLGRYFNDESFGVRPGDVVRTETPGTGVRILRDKHDMPHIYGETDESAAYGAGYAQAEDRLFLMDVLRHYGKGTLGQFLGASCELEQMDHDELLLAPYTEKQAQAQVDALPRRFPQYGGLAKKMLHSYVEGVNAYVADTGTDPSRLPADYAAGAPDASTPQPWSETDVVAIAGLIGGIFGRGGGFETEDAHLLTYLKHRYGTKDGRAAYLDFNHQNDPTAPTTITDKRFRYDVRTKPRDTSLTALPKAGALTGGPQSTTPGCASSSSSSSSAGSASPQATKGAAIVRALDALPQHMSNALVVNGSHTRSGHPIAVFGPQVSYFAPQILSVEEIQSPHYSAEGASFPGTGLVELGRGQDYAWSATSASSDLIDQRVEKICDPSGGTPSANGTSYLFKGTCVAMQREQFDEDVQPKASGPGAPGHISHVIYKTRHGVVQGWTTVNGQPVAIVNQRSTYNHDIDSIVGFLGFGDPQATHDVHSWMKFASKIEYTFNWFYADDRDTGYFVSGRDPIRNPAEDPTLPTWGTGRAEWRGFLPMKAHPHEINPRHGYFISWNNKPAPGFATDGEYPYGRHYRSQMLDIQLRRQIAAHPQGLHRSDVVKAMETAASQDLTGVKVTRLLLRYTSGHHHSADVTAMLGQLRSWVASGAHRLKAAPGDKQYAHASAVAINDDLVPQLVQALYDPVLAAGGKGGVTSSGAATVPGYTKLPMQWVNTPNSGDAHLGSAFDGGYEGYLSSTLLQLLGYHPRDGFGRAITRHECLGGTVTCRKAVDFALERTFRALRTANGSSAVNGWTDSTASHAEDQTMPEFDAIHFKPLGVVDQPAIDWQNRPTFQQVVEFPKHRAR